MSTDAAATTNRLEIVVSDDRTQAWLSPSETTHRPAEPPTEAEILAALEAQEIRITDDVRGRVEQCVQRWASSAGDNAAEPSEKPTAWLIAQGQPPVEARDGSFDWHERYQADLSKWKGDDSVNYYELSSVLTVEEDAVIGRIVEPADGTPGQDVFGNELQPRRPRGVPLELGSGLRLSPGGCDEVMTCAAGRVIIRRGQMWLEEILAVQGDVDFNSGSLDVCTQVYVSGTVRANFSVRTTKSLTVGGAIEAADVHVDGDVVVHGGILGRERLGSVRAGGAVTARYCEEADIRAEGDVKVCKELIHTNLRSNGCVLAQAGAIVASDVHGREGIEARTLGNDAGMQTQVSAGVHREIFARIRKLAQDIKQRTILAERIRARVEPLMTGQTALDNQQRSQVNSLLDKAEEMESSLEALQREHDELNERGQPQGQPFVSASKMIYPGVRVALGPRETVFDRPLAGPVRIEQRKVRGATEFVAVNLLSGSVTVLHSAEIDLSRISAAED